MTDIDYRRGPGPSRKPRRTIPSHGPAPCPWPDCRCTHIGCVGGWIDGAEAAVLDDFGQPITVNGKPLIRRATRPCPTCRPEHAKTLADRTLTRGQQMAKIRSLKER